MDVNTSQPLNAYVIQSAANSVDIVPDKPGEGLYFEATKSFSERSSKFQCALFFSVEPIKLLIKRRESEDEISDSPASRVKSKRTRQPRSVQ